MNIYNRMRSPRFWFVVIVILMICIFIKYQGISINNISDTTTTNPRAIKEYKYKTIDNINLTTNTGKLYISPIDSRNGWSQNISLISKNINKANGVNKEIKSNLYIWMYDITDDRVKQKLKQLTTTNNIYMIYETLKHSEKVPTEDYKWLVDGLKNAGVNIYNDDQMGVNFTHAKTMVGDSGFIIETMNWTRSSFDKNREFVFVGDNLDIRDSLINVFRKDLSGSEIKNTDIHPNLMICPIDCRAKLEYMISQAKSSIYIYNQYIDDPSIIELLQEKISKKLDVKIILAGGEKDEINKENFGNNFKAQNAPYPHAKVLLIDNKYLIISSINFSTNSMNRNREIGTITMDRLAIDNFKKVFDADWGK